LINFFHLGAGTFPAPVSPVKVKTKSQKLPKTARFFFQPAPLANSSYAAASPDLLADLSASAGFPS